MKSRHSHLYGSENGISDLRIVTVMYNMKVEEVEWCNWTSIRNELVKSGFSE
jgi:hypothetical protein